MNFTPTSYEIATDFCFSQTKKQEANTKVIVVYVPVTEGGDSPRGEGIVEEFQRLIQNYYVESNLKMRDLAQKMQMSEVQLYRKIKTLTNQSPGAHLRLFRLGKALELLEYATHLTISEIAYQVGFNEPNYFSRVFSEAFSTSPREMRKRFEKKERSSN